MLSDVVKVESRGAHRIWLQCRDGVEGEVDLRPRLTFQGVFAQLRDPAYFARVRVNSDLGTICWPNDADWDPLVLYSLVTGRPVETLLTRHRNCGAEFAAGDPVGACAVYESIAEEAELAWLEDLGDAVLPGSARTLAPRRRVTLDLTISRPAK